MTSFQLFYPQKINATIQLPTSKSISARALILSRLSGGCELCGLSDCDDTKALQTALAKKATTVDIGAAGTAMRFATAYLAVQEGEEYVLTGSQRMCERPIGVLVDALRSLGADIAYLEKEGYPPLYIKGKKLLGGELAIPAHVSSQYISALLMIAPTLVQGLKLTLQGEVASRPYLNMTLSLMKTFGACAEWVNENVIEVPSQPYVAPQRFSIEADWSAASYWYETVALSEDADASVFLTGLNEHSVQGDSVVASLFEHLGVHTSYAEGGVRLKKAPMTRCGHAWEVDFADCPDLAQTVVATCAMLQQPFRFSGLHSLRIKETDRIAALQQELQRFGIVVHSCQQERAGKSDEILEFVASVQHGEVHKVEELSVQTYKDHRMAMAFAPCALLKPGVRIEEPSVVSKSYPSFWDDLRQVGVTIVPKEC